MLVNAVSALLLPALVIAQDYGYGPVGPATTSAGASAAPAFPSAPASSAMVINIDVAAGQTFTFKPANVTAPVGATVNFYFPSSSISHSVTQSSFAQPCTYLAATSNTSAGFDSGLQTAAVFSINVTDTQPIWFHCKQVTHCGLGMVGSINAPSSGNTFDNFKAAAIAIGSNEVTETDNGPVTGGVNGIATAPPSTAIPSAAAAGSSSSTSSSSGSGGSGSSSGSTKVVATSGFALIMAGLVAFLA